MVEPKMKPWAEAGGLNSVSRQGVGQPRRSRTSFPLLPTATRLHHIAHGLARRRSANPGSPNQFSSTPKPGCIIFPHSPHRLPMRPQKPPHLIMRPDHMKIQQPRISGKNQPQRQPMPAFIKPLPQSADAAPRMGMRIPKRIPHLLDQLANLFALCLGKPPQSSQ